MFLVCSQILRQFEPQCSYMRVLVKKLSVCSHQFIHASYCMHIPLQIWGQLQWNVVPSVWYVVWYIVCGMLYSVWNGLYWFVWYILWCMVYTVQYVIYYLVWFGIQHVVYMESYGLQYWVWYDILYDICDMVYSIQFCHFYADGKLFPCNNCYKQLLLRIHLKMHMINYTAVKCVSCDYCTL